MHIEEQFVDWLKAAYFMEVDYAKALEEHLGPAKDYPRLHRLFEEHLWATTSHAYEVSLCLERLNWNVKDLSCDRSSLHAPFEQAPSTDQEAVVNNIIVELTTEALRDRALYQPYHGCYECRRFLDGPCL